MKAMKASSNQGTKQWAIEKESGEGKQQQRNQAKQWKLGAMYKWIELQAGKDWRNAINEWRKAINEWRKVINEWSNEGALK